MRIFRYNIEFAVGLICRVVIVVSSDEVKRGIDMSCAVFPDQLLSADRLKDARHMPHLKILCYVAVIEHVFVHYGALGKVAENIPVIE